MPSKAWKICHSEAQAKKAIAYNLQSIILTQKFLANEFQFKAAIFSIPIPDF